MAAIVIEKHESGNVVALEGVVDIACAAELRTALLGALGAGPGESPGTVSTLRVSVAELTYLDITAMQLLWAAARQAKSAGAGFEVVGDVPGAISGALADAGFASFLNSGAGL